MAIRNVNPKQALEVLRTEEGAVYLDVRSVPEFEQGHAEGAVNVPLLHMGPGGMEPNPDFLSVVEKRFPKDAKLVVGCKMGGRSAKACEILSQAGFENLWNVDGGFGGRPDAGDEAARAGWAGCGLPVEREAPPERTYEGLRGTS